MRSIFSFPDPVNEVAARLVAGGVVLMTALYLATGWMPVLFILAYGFIARVLSGPRFSPLAQLALEVVIPRLSLAERPVPGPPKRFAQGIGATLSMGALIAALAGAQPVAYALIAAIAVAASLEAFAGFCLGCKVFAMLMRLGIIPETVCEACADISRRRATV